MQWKEIQDLFLIRSHREDKNRTKRVFSFPMNTVNTASFKKIFTLTFNILQQFLARKKSHGSSQVCHTSL